MRKALLLFSVAALALSPSSVPAQYSVRTLDPALVAEARKEHPELVQEYGGAETGPRSAYVDSVGRRVAAYSGITDAGSAYHFTVLNSAVDNAFSVPGGYIYITRQLMTLMDDESELAFVLGHETGHVAAGHAQQREEAENRAVWQQLPWIMLGQMIGGNFGSIVARRGLVSAALETLSFSREQEYEADTLGLRYMVAAGYDPAGAPEMLEALTRNSAMEARVQGRENRQLPEWALTHPLSENRMQRAAAEAKASGRIGIGIRNRDGFLAQLNGVVVDDDPAQGIIDGRTFTHPDLRIQFSVPVGYLMQNGTRAVSISGSAGKAQFGGGRYRGNLDSYVYAVMQELAGNAQLEVPRPQHTVIDGVPAAYTITRANTDSGVVDVSVVAYQWAPDTVYHFVMLTAGGSGMGPFLSMVNSIRKITPAEAAAIRPRIVLVTTVRPGDTVQSLASRMAYRNFKVDRFLALNNLPSNARVEPGQKIKLVVYGQRRS